MSSIQESIILGSIIRIYQENVEGISKEKSIYMSRFLHEKSIDVVLLQETHTANESQLKNRGQIEGYDLIGATYHPHYGTATYVKSNIENAALISTNTAEMIFTIIINVGGTNIVNIYKPPNTSWPTETIQTVDHPAIYMGDFNSHHTQWKYSQNDNNGNALVEWYEKNDLHLVFDAKDRGTFKSARWKNEYNPDLCFVTKNSNGSPIQARRSVEKDFPHSQHRPVVVELGYQIPIIKSTPRPRWNFNKANWPSFTVDLDKVIRWIPPNIENYSRFINAITSTAKKFIPRGFRKGYVPGWNAESDRLYKEFLESGQSEIAEDLLYSLDLNRKDKWMHTVENMDFRKSSRKAWSILRKLDANSMPIVNKPNIVPKVIARRIVEMSRAPSDKSFSRNIRHELRTMKQIAPPNSQYSQPFNESEINTAISSIKVGKAAGVDGIYYELIKNFGTNVKRWLCKFYSKILDSSLLPIEFKETKIMAVLKPGKPNDAPESYRPIALMSCCLKLLERMIYNRISNTIFEHIQPEQAGFRPGRNCEDQVLALTSFIENGFQKLLKTSCVLIDLTAAYDTVWRDGLIYKLLKVIPCRKICSLINNMLSYRLFTVHLGDKISNKHKLSNGLAQGSVLAPLLFSLYISDLPKTASRKFGYADDWTLAVQHNLMEITQELLKADLIIISNYLKRWRLTPNLNKTEVSCFHLNNKLAKAELKVNFNGKLLKHNHCPKLLGVNLDRSLTFNQHLTKTSSKLRTRNNLIRKLTATSWGASAHVLRTSVLGLVYPIAEYCASVWLNSAHTNKIDVQLNESMRLITGTIQSTPLYWLPTLSNIAPANMRRQQILSREYRKIMSNPELPIHADINIDLPSRLKSRHSPLMNSLSINSNNFTINDKWLEEWRNNAPIQWQPIKDNNRNEIPSGFELTRKLWCTLNRIRTNHGKCNDSFYKWGLIDSPRCECNNDKQTINHIVFECPLYSFDGDVSDFINISDDAIAWMERLNLEI